MVKNVTRGSGILEGYLSRMRMKMANSLIPDNLRTGRILDVGCGSYPGFILNTAFQEKHGIDKVVKSDEQGIQKTGIYVKQYDLEREGVLPYPNGFADIVTLLAVIEHINPEKIISILKELKRILKSNGVLIITTPSGWTDCILRIFAKLNIVSKEEINEHKDLYTQNKLKKLLLQAGFKNEDMRFGFFELFMNIWATAENNQHQSQLTPNQ